MNKFVLILALVGMANASGRGVNTGVVTTCGVTPNSDQCGKDATNATPYANENGGTQSGYQTGATALDGTAAPYTLSNNTRYYLTADMKVSKTTLQFTMDGNIQLDLNGHELWGLISCNTGNCGGFSVFNGKIRCNTAALATNSAACVRVQGGAVSASRQVRTHDLDMLNEAVADGTTNAREVAFDWSPSGNTFGSPLFDMYNLTTSIGTYAGTRRPFLNTINNSNSPWRLRFSSITMAADTETCQGIQNSGSASVGEVSYNRFDFATNTTAADCRGVAIDANSQPTAADDLVTTQFNYFNVRNNRAFRCRSRHCGFYDNLIVGMVTDKDGYGTAHWADQQQNFTSPNQSYALSSGAPNAARNIWIAPASGRAHIVIAGQGVNIQDEVVWGGSGGVMLYASAANFVNKSISAISCAAGVATVTSTGHGMAVSATNTYGYRVTITGSGVSEYNVVNTLLNSVDDANTFKFSATCNGSAVAGTVTTNADTSVSIKNLPTLSNPNFTTNVGGTANGTVTYCNSGTGSTSGAGSGTATNTNSCP